MSLKERAAVLRALDHHDNCWRCRTRLRILLKQRRRRP
jgi:hypothetical protein